MINDFLRFGKKYPIRSLLISGVVLIIMSRSFIANFHFLDNQVKVPNEHRSAWFYIQTTVERLMTYVTLIGGSLIAFAIGVAGRRFTESLTKPGVNDDRSS